MTIILQNHAGVVKNFHSAERFQLPPYASYEILDAIIEVYVGKNCSPAEIITQNYDAAVVTQVIRSIHRNEYKRRQSPPGIRITRCDSGTAWRYPLTCRFPE
ncbi:MAG: hypothetical protein JSS37_12010 [Proteobacteria bacterium]|nr:hypothetical protein [Pseudomonadota bacterium]